MTMKNVNMPQSSQGFTLIEIMVVMVILGLLVAVVAPNIMGRSDQAKVTVAETQLTNISKALDIYRLDNRDRKSTRLNSSHVRISYAVFCLKKKKKKKKKKQIIE